MREVRYCEVAHFHFTLHPVGLVRAKGGYMIK